MRADQPRMRAGSLGRCEAGQSTRVPLACQVLCPADGMRHDVVRSSPVPRTGHWAPAVGSTLLLSPVDVRGLLLIGASDDEAVLYSVLTFMARMGLKTRSLRDDLLPSREVVRVRSNN